MASLLGTTTGVSFGASAETGILIDSFSLTATQNKREVMNEVGEVVLVAFSGKKATGTISGTIAGTTGVAAASVGAALTLANMESVGGVTTGTTVVDSVTISKSIGDLKKISIPFTRYPSI